MIRIENISKRYDGSNGVGQVEAVAGITLEIREREFLSFLGPSGCGKSTVLRLIGGLDAPTGGRIEVDGGTPEAARTNRVFGYVFQDPVLLEWRTVAENVRLPGEVYADSEIVARTTPSIELVGLGGFEKAFPGELSGGMKSRAAIARALTVEPRVLLMDEPFADLDEITRLRLNLELLRIWESTGATAIFVTHSVMEAAFLSDRIALLSGRPARLQEVVDVPLGRPRSADDMETECFMKFVRELRTRLS